MVHMPFHMAIFDVNAAEEVIAQFGNYGPQKGELPATISAQEQQKQTVEAIEAFLAQRTEG